MQTLRSKRLTNSQAKIGQIGTNQLKVVKIGLRWSKISGPQKGPAERGHVQKTSKIVEKCQKHFHHFSTIFAQGKKSQKSSKVSKIFSTIYARHQFSGPFWGALIKLDKIGVLALACHFCRVVVPNMLVTAGSIHPCRDAILLATKKLKF